MVKALALSVLLSQSLPPLVQPNTPVTAGQLSLPVAISPNSAPVKVTTIAGDAGSSVQFSADLPGYLCAPTAGAALPYAATTTCINGQNQGPNPIVIAADGGNAACLTNPLLCGTQVQPGQPFALCPSGVPLLAIATVANQTDGGCIQYDQTR